MAPADGGLQDVPESESIVLFCPKQDLQSLDLRALCANPITGLGELPALQPCID